MCIVYDVFVKKNMCEKHQISFFPVLSLELPLGVTKDRHFYILFSVNL